MPTVRLGDVTRWSKGFGYVIDPPLYAVVTYIPTERRGEFVTCDIIDRGGLNPDTAINGNVSFSPTIPGTDADIEVLKPDEIPDHIITELAAMQLLNEGGKKP